MYHDSAYVTSISPQSGPVNTASEITITGFNFMESTTLKCAFKVGGDTKTKLETAATYVSKSQLKCDSPSIPTDHASIIGGTVTSDVEITLNGIDFTSTKTPFVFHAPITITTIIPQTGPESGGTSVTIVGSNFLPFDSLSCQFSGNNNAKVKVKGKYISSNAVVCVSPSVGIGDSEISLSNNGVFDADFDADAIPFQFHASLFPLSLAPMSGSAAGGTEVIVTGNNFPNSPSLSCKFGNIITSAVFNTHTEIICTTPGGASRKTRPIATSVPLLVSANGRDFANPNNLSYLFVPLPTVSSIYPASGPLSGGSIVSVVGSNFNTQSGHNVICKFGPFEALATVQSENVLTCESPSSLSPTILSLEISTNGGIDYSTSNFMFVFQKIPVLNTLHPPAGMEDGGNKVIVRGSGFYESNTLACRFGESLVHAAFISETSISCEAPAAASVGHVGVVATLNGVDWTANQLVYTYTPTVSIHRLSPTSCAVGGGTTVTISGQNFATASGVANLALSCDFGDLRSTATVVSDSVVTCVAPPVGATGAVKVTITAAGFSIMGDHAMADFVFFEPSTVAGVVPSFGSSVGGTLVSVSGTNFNGLSGHGDLFCSFELDVAGPEPVIKTSIATVVSNELLTCFTPEEDAVGADTYDDESFVNNSELSIATRTGLKITGSSSVSFTFRSSPTIKSISPSVGDVVGSTNVLVTAEQYSASWVNSSDLTCSFGTTRVSGVYVSPRSVSCVSPASTDGVAVVLLAVANNGKDFGEGAEYLFSPSPVVSSIFPSSGPLVGGTKLQISGTGFANANSGGGVTCRFFNEAAGIMKHAKGIVISSELVECSTPSLDTDTDTALPVTVIVGNNEVEYNQQQSSNNKFAYFPDAKIGSISPLSGAVGGTTAVTISGSNFKISDSDDNAEGVVCKLGADADAAATVFAASSTTSNTVICDVVCPASNANKGPRPIQLSLNSGHDYTTNDNFVFYCDEVPVVDSIVPSFDEINSGRKTTLTISGSKFTDRPELSCSFGGSDAVSGGKFVNDNTVLCDVEASATIGRLSVSVSNNGLHYSAESAGFNFVPAIGIEGVGQSEVSVGGVLVVVGVNFVDNSALTSCKVNGVYATSVEFISVGKVACTLSVSTPQTQTQTQNQNQNQNTVDIELNFNGVAAHGKVKAVALNIFAIPVVSSVFPTEGPTNGESLVYVSGSNFRDTPSLQCKFGDVAATDSVYVSSRLVKCTTTAAEAAAAVVVQVSNDGFASSSHSNVAFNYFQTVFVRSVHPAAGGISGGTSLVVVADTHYDSTASYDCVFFTLGVKRAELKRVVAQHISPKAISCISPSVSIPEIVRVGIVLSGTDTPVAIVSSNLDADLEFEYYEEPAIVAMEPSSGSVSGGTVVTVSGHRFVLARNSASAPFCKFGSAVVAGTVVDGSTMNCVAPQVDFGRAGAVGLSVSLNGADYSVGFGGKFLYSTEMMVESVGPLNGPVSGDTGVVFGGSNLSPRADTQCKFGEVSTFAYYYGGDSHSNYSSNSFVCNTPPKSAGGSDKVEVFVKLDSSSEFVSTGYEFVYDEEMVVSSVNPLKLSQTGNTRVTIVGTNFTPGAGTTCKFGDSDELMLVNAEVVSDTTMYCLAPVSPNNNHVSLRISQNQNINSVMSSELLKFEDSFSLSSVVPNLGPSQGGSLVTILGSGFTTDGDGDDADRFYCQFGTTLMVASRISDSEITCETSPLLLGTGIAAGDHAKEVKVSVVRYDDGRRLGGGETENTLSFYMYSSFAASTGGGVTILPALGPNTGGTDIIIGGLDGLVSGLVEELNLRIDMKCKFGDSDSSVVVDGRINNGVAHCNSPASASALAAALHSVPVRVSLNGGQDFVATNSAPLFTFYDQIVVNSTVPSSVPANAGSSVDVVGENFPDVGSLSCRFGSGSKMPGTFISSTQIQCSLPETMIGGGAVNNGMSVAVTVSANDQDFSKSAAALELRFEPMAADIEPKFVSMDGSTLVSVVGTNFVVGADSIFARLSLNVNQDGDGNGNGNGDRVEVLAPMNCESTTLCTFVSPSQTTQPNSIYDVDISNNGIHFISTGMQVVYKQMMRLDDVSPVSGGSAGGATVIVTGQGFVEHGEISQNCVFGTVSIFARYIDEQHLSCVTPESRAGAVTLKIERNGEISQSALTFTYTDTHMLTALNPTSVPELGNTLLTVMGENFEKTANVSCVFDSHGSISIQAATVTSKSSVTCRTPKMALGKVAVFVSSNGVDTVGNSIALSVVGQYSVLSLSPVSGLVTGKTVVSVVGSGFGNSDVDGDDDSMLKTYCVFGKFQSPATVISSTELQCLTPNALDPDSTSDEDDDLAVDFSVVVRHPYNEVAAGVATAVDNLTFSYQQVPKVTLLTPGVGSVHGGTTVTISGENFGTHPLVRFSPLDDDANKKPNAYALKVTVLSSSKIEVVTPAMHAGWNAIEISTNNGHDFSVNNAQFKFDTSPADIAIEPSVVPEMSDVTVTISGSNFVRSAPHLLKCKVGDVELQGLWVSDNVVTCVLEAGDIRADVYKVSLSMNGGVDYVEGPALVVRPSIELVSLFPSRGPSRGTTDIFVEGLNFDAEYNIVCIFNEKEIVPTVVTSESSLSCKSPSMRRFGYEDSHSEFVEKSVPFQLGLASIDSSGQATSLLLESTAGVSADKMSNGLKFEYYDEEIVESVTPSAGPHQGGSKITVAGRWFENTPELSCKVGSAAPVKATFVSSEEIVCVVPSAEKAFNHLSNGMLDAVSEFSNLAVATVRVSNNGIDFDSSSFQSVSLFSYYFDVVLAEVSPPAGPELGGAVVHVHIDCDRGEFLQQEGSSIENGSFKCKFGNSVVDGTFVSKTTMSCVAPGLDMTSGILSSTGLAHSTEVTVSMNGVDYSESSATYSYTNTPTVYLLEPTMGFYGETNLVTVLGSNFATQGQEGEEDVFCRFGAIVVKASVVSDSELTCVAPNQQPGPVVVEITNHQSSNQDGSQTTVNDSKQWTSEASTSTNIYMYLPQIKVESIYPRHGSVLGGTPLLVGGVDFPELTNLCCVFGEQGVSVTVPAVFGSSKSISCTTPPSSESESYNTVPFGIGICTSYGLSGYLHSNLAQFSFTSVPFVSSISPHRGLSFGSTVVTVQGGNFHHQKDIMCKFGAAGAVVGKFISDESVECVTPAVIGGVRREVQELTVSSRQSQVEVQKIEIVPKEPLNNEVARVEVYAWGEDAGNGIVAQTIRVMLLTEIALGGTWRLEYGGVQTDYFEYDVSPEALKTEIERVLFKSVRVSQVILPSGSASTISDSYSGYDIEMLSAPGGIVAGVGGLTCDSTLLTSPLSGNMRCTVVEEVATNSVALGGEYKLAFKLETAGGASINALSTAAEVKTSLESISHIDSVDVNVETSSLAHMNGVSYLITFTAAVAENMEGIDFMTTGTLTGTDVKTNYDEVVIGSYVSGTFDLSFAGESPAAAQNLDFDATNGEVAAALESFSLIETGSVVVNRAVTSNNSFKWLCTFNSLDAGINNLTPLFDNLDGEDGLVMVVEETVLGTMPLDGKYKLVFDGETTDNYLNTTATAEEVKLALESLSTVGFVEVEKIVGVSAVDADTSINYVGNNYLVTFTTFGEPSNIGTLPLITSDVSMLLGSDARVAASLHTEGCCNVEVSLNGGVDYFGSVDDSSNLVYTYDERSTVLSIEPSHGKISGGTAVVLSGSGFTYAESYQLNNKEVLCVFGSKEVPAVFESPSTVSCVTPSHVRGSVVVTVRQNGENSTASAQSESSATFDFVEKLQIVDYLPRNIGVQVSNENYKNVDGSRVDAVKLGLFGENFLSSGIARCEFYYSLPTASSVENDGVRDGHYFSTVTYYNSSYVECDSTPTLEKFYSSSADSGWSRDDKLMFGNTTLAFKYTTNRVDYTNEFELQFVPLQVVEGVVPTTGGMTGSTEVVVSGKNFVPGEGLLCKFGNASATSVVVGDFVDSEHIICVTPPHFTGEYASLVNVEVSVNGQEYSNDEVKFEYHEDIVVEKLWPSFGPSEGGTVVTLKLDDNEMALRSLPLSPTYDLVHGVHVTRGVNDASEQFRDAYEMELNAVNTVNFNFGSSYSNVLCKFNNSELVAATVVDGVSVSCVSPMSANSGGGPVTVEISVNGGVDWTKDEAIFVYSKGVLSETVVLVPSHGVRRGGTLVNVTNLSGLWVGVGDAGTNTKSSKMVKTTVQNADGSFTTTTSQDATSVDWSDHPIAAGNALCRFGEADFAAYAVDARYGVWIVCESPTYASAQTADGILGNDNTVSVDVSLNGVDFTTNLKAQYRYEEDIFVSSVLPSWGPVSGGSLVEIEGGGFFNYSYGEVMCKFGDVKMEAEYLSSSKLQCRSPSLGSVDEVQKLSVFSMAWAPEIQSITANVEDYLSEIHNISTRGPRSPQDEIQRYTISTDDVNEVQMLTTNVDTSGDVVLTVEFDVMPMLTEVQSLYTEGGGVGGFFMLYSTSGDGANVLVNDNSRNAEYAEGEFFGEGVKYTTYLDFDVSAGLLASEIESMNSSWAGVSVTRAAVGEAADNNYKWEIVFPSNAGNVDMLQVSSHTLTGSTGSGSDATPTAYVLEDVKGSVVEIQTVSLTAASQIYGNFTLSLDGYVTRSIDWNSTAAEVETALEELDSVGDVTVVRRNANVSKNGNLDLFEHYDDDVVGAEVADNVFELFEWEVRFDSHAGDVNALVGCCSDEDLRNANDVKAIASLGARNGDARIVVAENRKGTSEALGGFYTVTLNTTDAAGINDIQTSGEIGVGMKAEEIQAVLEGTLSNVEAGSVVVEQEYLKQENLLTRSIIKFGGFQNAANFTTTNARKPVVVTVEGGMVVGEAAVLKHGVDQMWNRKIVMVVDGNGVGDGVVVSCTDSLGNNGFTFAKEATALTVKNQMESVEEYGVLLVSKFLGSWTITFDSLAGDLDELICDSGAVVSKISGESSEKISSGSYLLNFNGVETAPLDYDATAAEIEAALESLASINEIGGVEVSGSGVPNANGGYSYLVTFSGSSAWLQGDLNLITGKASGLGGTNSYVEASEVVKGNEVGGSYRMKFVTLHSDHEKLEWSPYIPFDASALLVEQTLREMAFIDDISVTFVASSLTDVGGRTMEITFPHFLVGVKQVIDGEEVEVDLVPKTAANLEPTIFDLSQMTGENTNIASSTVQDGTHPVSTIYNRKGFRLITPGGSKAYPLTQHTRWLSSDETAESMRLALVDAGGLPAGFWVKRTGPFSDGGYEWQVFLPKVSGVSPLQHDIK